MRAEQVRFGVKSIRATCLLRRSYFCTTLLISRNSKAHLDATRFDMCNESCQVSYCIRSPSRHVTS